MRLIAIFSALAGAVLLPVTAMAHGGHAAAMGTGIGAGFFHPLSGIDHILAMVTLGLWAGQESDRTRHAAVAIVTVLVSVAGLISIALPTGIGLEWILALSVVVMGTILIFPRMISPSSVILLAGVFGLAHGYAHGAEIPTDARTASYIIGLGMMTLLLQLAGIVLGRLLTRQGRFVRILGSGAALSGLVLMAA